MAAETNGDIIWIRDSENSSDHDDIWDDSALIDAYDRAVGQVKEELERRKNDDQNGTKKKSAHRPKLKNTWKVGDYCNTVYPEDGLFYEAYIKEISESGVKCVIEYVGYGNTLAVPISTLKPSLGKQAREQQEYESSQTTQEKLKIETDTAMDWSKNDSQKKNKFKNCKQDKSDRQQDHIPYHPSCSVPHSSTWPGFVGQYGLRSNVSPIPPPPAFPFDQGIPNDEEALAAMLMSWYMSGYHTGYYQALRQTQGPQAAYKKFQASYGGCTHSP